MAQLSASQRAFAEKAYSAAYDAGLSGPQADLAVAQAVHETAWGAKPSGVNNYHGIKGPGTKVATHEVVNGKTIGIKDSFRNFPSMTGSFKAWGGLMGRRFGDVLSAGSVSEAVKGLRAGLPGGYATDPNYNSKVNSIADKIAGLDPMGSIPSIDRIATPTENPRSLLAYSAPVAPVQRAALSPVKGTAFTPGGVIDPTKIDVSPVSSAVASPASMAVDPTRFGPRAAPNVSFNSLRSLPSVPALQSAPAPFSPTPASYQTAAFSTAAPKMDAFGQPPAPGLQPAAPSPYSKAPAPQQTMAPALAPATRTISSPKVASVPDETTIDTPAPDPALNSFPDKPSPGIFGGLFGKPSAVGLLGQLAGVGLGTAAAGPLGGIVGGLLGKSLANNAGGSLGGLLSNYNGPTNNIGSGLGAISSVMNGAPVGTQASSRSMPGMTVTSLPGGAIQRTNQFGMTQITTADGRTGRATKGRTGGAGGNYGGVKSEGARNAIDHGVGGLF